MITTRPGGYEGRKDRKMLTIEYSPAHGVTISNARRLNEEEKTHYVEWYQDYGFIAQGDAIELPHIGWEDMPARPADGEFQGCNNQAWIITEEEAESYKRIEAERVKEEELERIRKHVEECKQIVEACEHGYIVDNEEQAKRRATEYNNVHNEGGEGYVPTWYTHSNYKDALAYIAENENK